MAADDINLNLMAIISRLALDVYNCMPTATVTYEPDLKNSDRPVCDKRIHTECAPYNSCRALRAVLSGKRLRSEEKANFLAALSEETKAQKGRWLMPDLDGDGKMEWVEEFSYEPTEVSPLGPGRTYCGRSDWKVPEEDNRLFAYLVNLSAGGESILIKNSSYYVKARD
jgi:hypothetical protein